MNDELQHLKNLGKTSAQWLHAVGIHSASDLRAARRGGRVPCRSHSRVPCVQGIAVCHRGRADGHALE